MGFVRNFPAISILICMFAAIISSGLPRKAARLLNTLVILAVFGLSLTTFIGCLQLGEPVVYVMGIFPAPWGNEIRFGVLESGMALFFSIIMLLSIWGGRHKMKDEVARDKEFLYYVFINLLFSSLLALVYTNDLFTAYVFVEINTISACGLIVIRENGRTIEAGVRYMIMSLLGSGLLLLGIMMTYDITGHLLMSNIKEAVGGIVSSGESLVPLVVTIALLTTGLCIKSALFPFHSWLPDAYGYSTVSSAAILSSLVSKGYIFLLIKIFYRVIGFDTVKSSRLLNVLFVFGLIAMISGSVSAIRENDIRRMIAFSSIAQIGYIYMGFGMGTRAGMVASIFHILSHAATKSMLFISAIGLTDVSHGSRHFIDLTGSAHRNKIAGIGFLTGSLSMVGIPLFSGFISKLQFMDAAVSLTYAKMLPALIVLGISTILNAIYFMKTVLRIYMPIEKLGANRAQADVVTNTVATPQRMGINGVVIEKERITLREEKLYGFVIHLFVILNIALGVCSNTILDWIRAGIDMFS
ncbi:MAG: sodium:proton antiporter [Lachnospiraceae bacterium]|nr:sodium:proton antiporter [Lachnospiraceae bacterium]